MPAHYYRLCRDVDFQRVYRRGWYANGVWLTFRMGFGVRGKSRFGIVVPNTVMKRAVDRHRIQRQLRVLITEQLVFFRQGFDYILQVRATPPHRMGELRSIFIETRERVLRMHISTK